MGARFGRNMVVDFGVLDGETGALVMCDCGRVRWIKQASDLLRGRNRTCGCDRQRMCAASLTTHGKSGSLEYAAWHGAKSRCAAKPGASHWPHYGARGIRVCARWGQSFEAFLADMGSMPGPGYTLERKDLDRGYELENCVWLKRELQQRNRRSVVLTYEIAEEMRALRRGGASIASIARHFGVKRATALSAINGDNWAFGPEGKPTADATFHPDYRA